MLLYAAMVIWDVIEFLAFPALCILIGVWNHYPWQYYAATVGGYFALFLVLEVVLRLIFKAFDKKFESFIERKLKKYLHKSE